MTTPGEQSNAAQSLVPIATGQGPAYLQLLRLASDAARGGQHRWEDLIDGVLRRLHELSDLRPFELIAAVWQARLTEVVDLLSRGDLDDTCARDLNSIVTALDCVTEHLTSPGWLGAADLAVRYRVTDAAAMARAACSSFRPLAERRDVALTVDFPEKAVVEADPAKLETLLLALLFNAFKHTPMRGTIRCSLRRAGSDDRLTISVADSGPGIAAAESAALFQAGEHDRSASIEVDGRTVSLGTARAFARLHGGSLVLRATQKRRGCILEASIPARAPRGTVIGGPLAGLSGFGDAVAAQAREELELEDRLGAKVERDERPLALIVEDNPHTQRILALTLGPAYNVAAAFDGEEGVAKARELKPDIIITDVRMPHMDGETMVHHLRAHAELAAVPILVLTASDDRATVVRLLEAGVEDVLRKPFEIQEVRARVRALIASKRARDTLNATIGHHEDNLLALAEEVASRQRGLEAALRALAIERDNARRANRVKGNFLRMMSHELKTPVAALQLQLHLFERAVGRGDEGGAGDDHSGAGAVDRDGSAPSASSLPEGIARMRRSTRRLALLIETMTEWARLESGRFKLDVANVELGGLLRAAVENARASTSSKDMVIELAFDALPPLRTDARLVALLLQNLLAFALQLNAGAPLSLRATSAGEAQQIRLRCGAPAGMDGSFGDEVFSAFQDDMDIGSRSGAGSGLGLRVVRDIVRAIGGELELVPSDEKGTHVFVMTLRSATSTRGAQDAKSDGGPYADPSPIQLNPVP